MPYISKFDREYIDNSIQNGISLTINDIANIIKNIPSKKVKGAVNYFVTRLVLLSMKPENGWSYSSLSDTVSVCKDVAVEIERRLLSKYEDNCIVMNGDIPEYV